LGGGLGRDQDTKAKFDFGDEPTFIIPRPGDRIKDDRKTDVAGERRSELKRRLAELKKRLSALERK
jgi:hypothetical protein